MVDVEHVREFMRTNHRAVMATFRSDGRPIPLEPRRLPDTAPRPRETRALGVLSDLPASLAVELYAAFAIRRITPVLDNVPTCAAHDPVVDGTQAPSNFVM